MKRRIRMLTLVVHATALLLALAAALVVVGIFNEALDWDLFGPKLEAILTGVFGGSIALASAGVALTVVLGIQEIVRAFRALPKAGGADEAAAAPEATRGGYARAMAAVLVGFRSYRSSGGELSFSSAGRRYVRIVSISPVARSA